MSITIPRPYERQGETLVQYHRLTEKEIVSFRADAIRQERTGTHARLSICMNNVSLAYSNFNIEKDEERVRLANSAYKHLNGNGQARDYPATFLKKDLDLFVEGLWDAYTSVDMAVYLNGATDPRPPIQIVRGLVVQGGGSIFFAPPGTGKSWSLLTMAVSIDAGISTMYEVVQQQVLFINLERSKQSIENRLGAVNRALGLEAARPLLTINARGKSLTDILGAARKSIDCEGVHCVLLDSISRAGAGDLTENGPMNKVVDMLNGLAETWAGIAHTPRASDDHAYGSVMLDAGADVMAKIMTQTIQTTMGIGLKVTKENDLGTKPLHLVALEFDPDLGLVGARKARLREFTEIEEAARPPTREDLIERYLLKVGKASVAQIAANTGFNPTTIAEIVNSNGRFVLVGGTKTGALYGAASHE